MMKISMKTAAAALMLAAAAPAHSQSLNDLLGAIANKTGNTEKGSDIISDITSIFSKDKQASEKTIVGTWEYAEPAIVFKSDNLLTKAGAKYAAEKIEEGLQSKLLKYGFTPGRFAITFNEDGTFEERIGTKTVSGKWQIKDNVLEMTFGKIRPKTMTIDTQIEKKNLLFVTDASKLLTLFKNLSSQSSVSELKTVSALMKNVDGMQVGISLVKKQ